MKSLLAGVTLLALLFSPISVIAETTLPPSSSYGETGTKVKELQSFLKKLGYFVGEETGAYYAKTATAVKQLQSNLGILASGKAFGALTKAKLSTSLSSLTPSQLTAQVAGAGIGLIAAYNFEEGSGTTLVDRSGNGNSGTLINGPTWGAGKYGGALSFDGSNDYVNIPHAATLNFGTGDFTISAWVYPRDMNSPMFVGKLGTTGNGWRFSSSPYGRLTFEQNTNVGFGNNTVSINSWQHVAIVQTSAGAKFYQNGVEVSNTLGAGGNFDNTIALMLGTTQKPPGGDCCQRYYNGFLDDVRVYNRALTSSEITSDMNNAIGGSGVTPPPPPPSPSPAPVPTASLSASPTSINSGSASILAWSSTNASSCTASNGWTGTKTTSGTQSVTPTVTTTYTITCSGSGGTSAPQSTSVTVSAVVTPPPPPPPSGSNALSTLAASMAPGTWAQLSVPNQDSILGVGGVSGSMTHYCNAMPWNPVTKKIEIIGMDHNWGKERYVQYDPGTNSFVLVSADLGWGAQTRHCYDHTSVNPTTGVVFHRLSDIATGVITIRYANSGSTNFTTAPTIATGYDQIAIGATYWSGTFLGAGSQGAFMIFNSGDSSGGVNDGHIVAWDPVQNSWIFNKHGMAPNYMISGSTYHSVMEYSPIKNVAVYGGGNDASTRLWRLNSDGTVTKMPDVPTGLGVGVQSGNLVNDPVSGNFLLFSKRQLWELNPDGAGTWTRKTDPPAGAGDPSYTFGPDGIISSAISDYGVVAYIKQTTQTTSSFYLYKPSSSGGVTPPPPPPTTPTASLSASPASITSGSASTLTWSSTNATSCTASNGWTGTKTTSGTQSVTPTVTTTYTITCSGSGGTSAPQSASVTVSASTGTVNPTWLQGQAAGEWRQIPNTAMSSVVPTPVPPGNGPNSKVSAWNSFSIDPRDSKVYSAANGGHNDYAGNEVDVLEIETNSPLWIEKIAPTPAAQLTNCQSYYADGRPNSRHSSYGHVLVPQDNRIMLIGGAWWCASGGFHNAVSSYNITTNSWNSVATHPDAPTGNSNSAVTLDSTTGDIYNFGSNWNVFKWTRSTNAWSTQLSNTIVEGYGAMSAFDTTRNRILVLGGDMPAHHLYAPATNSLTPVTLIGASAASVSSVTYGGMVYSPELDRFLVRTAAAGGAVYQINPTTFEVTVYTTSAGASIPATINGPYNKFLYSPRLGGIVYIPDYSSNAWFLKIASSGTVTPTPPPPPPTPVNGSCGSANGTTVSSAPTTNLCTAGTASSVTGTGPWTWSCAGTSGGTTASCSANLTPVVSTKFVIGDRIQVSSGPLNVRATPNTTGTLLGTQATGIQGTVVSGPINQGGFNWWNVNFDSGVDGYSVEDFMVKASVVTPPPPPPSPSPLPASDFSTRCSAAGVIRCEALDSLPKKVDASVVMPIPTGYLPGNSTDPIIDTSIKTSGVGSVKFTIPTNSSANAAGSVFFNFANDYSNQIDQNSDVYVQWRQRFSPEFIAGDMSGGGWKQVIIGSGSNPGAPQYSCTDLETVVVNGYYRGFAQMYNSCSGSASHGAYDGFEQPFVSPISNTDFKLQNARPAPYCLYAQSGSGHFPPNGNCIGYFPNEWMTFQVHIKTGPRVGNEFQNSHVDLWIARDGQPSQQALDWGPYNLTAGPVGENQKFGQVWLVPYDTGKQSTFAHPTAYTWYDDLIISRNKIADPASSGTVTPTPPPPPPTPVNGSCGSANGTTVSSAPTTNLCTAGTASSVTGTGPWTWSCAGTSGGTTASCSANLTPPVSTKFVIGDRVQVSSGPLNVRATANTTGTLLGTQATGIQGTVVSGPTLQGGFNWWNINFDSGVDGYAAEDFTVKAPTPTPTASLTVAPTSITSGSASTLTWSATNATSCTASNGWSGTKTTSGTLSVTPTVTTTYTITCTGSGGTSLPKSASVTVTTPTPPPPSPTPTPIPVVTLSVTPTTGTVNSVNPVLTWSVTGSPTSCTASGDWTGTKATSGVSALQGILTTVRTYSYTLICSNAGGASLPKSASVVVSGAPVTPPAPTPPPPAPAPSPSPSSGGGGGGGSTPTPPPPSPSPSSGGGGGGSFTPPPPTPAPKPHVTLTKDLTLGSTGTEVTALQQFLVQTGYLTESYTSSTFDTPTQTAVGKYQCANAITCSGVPGKFGYGNVGPVTRASMASGSTGGSVTPTPAPTPLPSGTTTPKVTLTKNLSRGAKGLEVTLLQNFLIQSGYLAAGSATGYYGPLTQKAVQAYQCAKGIACSGTPASSGYGAVGPKTRRMMGG